MYGLEGPVSAYQHLVSCAEFAEEGLTATTYVVVSWETRVVWWIERVQEKDITDTDTDTVVGLLLLD